MFPGLYVFLYNTHVYCGTLKNIMRFYRTIFTRTLSSPLIMATQICLFSPCAARAPSALEGKDQDIAVVRTLWQTHMHSTWCSDFWNPCRRRQGSASDSTTQKDALTLVFNSIKPIVPGKHKKRDPNADYSWTNSEGWKHARGLTSRVEKKCAT